MFFVGATGHILPLLLSVCLPMVFLFSGGKQLDIGLPSENIIIHQSTADFSPSDLLVYDCNVDLASAEELGRPEFDDIPVIKKLPPGHTRIRWKPVYAQSSGNKAPPVSLSLSC